MHYVSTQASHMKIFVKFLKIESLLLYIYEIPTILEFPLRQMYFTSRQVMHIITLLSMR